MKGVKVCFNPQQVVFIWYADYFFKMPKTSPLCIYWALTWNKLKEPGDMLVTNDTFKAGCQKFYFQSWWSRVTKLVVANVTLRFAGHTLHFQIWLSQMSLSDTPIHYGLPSCFQCVMMRNCYRGNWKNYSLLYFRWTEVCGRGGKKKFKKIKYCVYPWHLTTHFW